ncbi:hypothetical protein GGS23DRAFT_119698 [Durotheca rogersii]|uniref:uncharacterized protein n=1 Tax=Durotheca rogersii TaxID=419775 RepID=UPI00221FF9A6|nr:uncharacterized protein GGS23DRAFT_119698 [Durotheca rogersii]KAI5861931.1 hypothetical protein GGS23DRAFT_119698 [Durotheca rogersii]
MSRRVKTPLSSSASSHPSPSATAATPPSSSSTATSVPAATLRPRRDKKAPSATTTTSTAAAAAGGPAMPSAPAPASWAARNRWVVLAVASGACAAFNGVFAKLTTNDLTTHIARGVSGALGLADLERLVEVVARGAFFGLNLVFNGVMWALFTQALAAGRSTTQVAVVNTSANFVATALLGLALFAERLPPLWWAGAALLVAGNVVIGRGSGAGSGDGAKEGEEEEEEEEEERERERGVSAYGGTDAASRARKDGEEEEEEEDVALLGDLR